MEQEVLAHVLQLLPAADRFNAALACSAWQSAADAATHTISLDRVLGDAPFRALQAWLPKRGQHVTSLHLQLDRWRELRQLPCGKVRNLEVQGGHFRPPLLPEATAANLTRLVLQKQNAVQAFEAEQLLQELCQLTKLEHLSLHITAGSATAGGSAAQLTGPEVWRSMRSLTYLDLWPVSPADDIGQHLSHLTNLEELHLGCDDPHNRPSTQCLQHLQRLTRLAFRGPARITVEECGSLGPLSNLCSLQLHRCSCDARALIGALTSLQDLSVKSVEWIAPMAVYQWLAQLAWLTSLTVAGLRELAEVVPNGSTTCAAVTASPHLQRLDLSGQEVHRSVWQVIFPAGRLLQQLQSLQLYNGSSNAPLLEAAAMQALVQCCPALTSLHGGNVLPVGPALGSLRHLTCLHAMQADDIVQAGALAALTNLQQLVLRIRPRMKWKCQDLQPLHQLTGLTHLSFSAGEVQQPPAVSDAAASVLPKLAGLVRLDVSGLSLTEQQLSRLRCLRALTCLQVSTAGLAVWMVDRLGYESCPLPGVRMYNRAVILNKVNTTRGRAWPTQGCRLRQLHVLRSLQCSPLAVCLWCSRYPGSSQCMCSMVNISRCCAVLLLRCCTGTPRRSA